VVTTLAMVNPKTAQAALSRNLWFIVGSPVQRPY
jgi:hypothetical protein